MHLLIRGDGVAMLCVYFCEKLFNSMERNCLRQNQWFAESGLQFGEWGYRDDVSVFQMMITSHEEMMEAAFGRNVIAFVRKVGNWDRLSEVLHNFQQEHQCMVDVTWKKKVWQIDVSQILYIQSADNYSRVVFYLQGELVQALQSYTMKEWERILPEQGFCRISRFVIVNYAYVEDIQKTSLIMEDSMRFNIPNGKVRRLRQEYIAYAREHERVL